MKRSAGILLRRRRGRDLEVLLAHPGGPLFGRRDDGAWSIPKGEYEPGETALDAACREFAEETGHPVPAGPVLELGEARQRGGKLNTVFAVEGDLDPATCVSNDFEMVWRGRRQRFPEMDRFGWFDHDAAARKLFPSQVIFLERLTDRLVRG